MCIESSERLLEVGGLVSHTVHLTLEGVKLLLGQRDKGLLARPVVVGHHVVDHPPPVLFHVVEAKPVVVKGVRLLVAVAEEGDGVLALVVRVGEHLAFGGLV